MQIKGLVQNFHVHEIYLIWGGQFAKKIEVALKITIKSPYETEAYTLLLGHLSMWKVNYDAKCHTFWPQKKSLLES